MYLITLTLKQARSNDRVSMNCLLSYSNKRALAWWSLNDRLSYNNVTVTLCWHSIVDVINIHCSQMSTADVCGQIVKRVYDFSTSQCLHRASEYHGPSTANTISRKAHRYTELSANFNKLCGRPPQYAPAPCKCWLWVVAGHDNMRSGADLRGGSPLVSFGHVIGPHFVTFSNSLYTTISNPNPNANPIPNTNPNQTWTSCTGTCTCTSCTCTWWHSRPTCYYHHHHRQSFISGRSP